MGKRQRFEAFLIERNDELDNITHELALLMLSANGVPLSESDFPWNMEIISAILESTKITLEDHGYLTCWPYNENDTPCFDTDSCRYESCPFKHGRQKGGYDK